MKHVPKGGGRRGGAATESHMERESEKSRRERGDKLFKLVRTVWRAAAAAAGATTSGYIFFFLTGLGARKMFALQFRALPSQTLSVSSEVTSYCKSEATFFFFF